jgi:hypothetical protein
VLRGISRDQLRADAERIIKAFNERTVWTFFLEHNIEPLFLGHSIWSDAASTAIVHFSDTIYNTDRACCECLYTWGEGTGVVRSRCERMGAWGVVGGMRG